MVLTSIKNYPIIRDNADSLGLTYTVRNGTIRIKSKGLSEENVQNRLIEDFGIGSIIEKESVFA